MKIRNAIKGIKLASIFIFLSLLTACYDVKQEITLNPDGSGKSVVEAYIQTNLPGSDLQTTNDDGTSTAKEFLRNSKGVEAWKDVQYKRASDGRIYFKGTAFFKDYSQLNIHNAGFDLSVKQDGNFLIIQGREDKSEKKSKNEKPDKTKIEQSKKEWQAMKPMMAAMMENFKQQDTIKVPGKIIESSNFTKISDNTIQLSVTGQKLIQVVDSLMNNDELLQKLENGKDPSEMGLSKDFNEFIFGSPLRAKFQLDSKPSFDYNAEIGPAKSEYAKLMETFEITAPVKAVETESNGLHFAVSRIEDTRSTQDYRKKMELEITISGDLLSRSGEPRSVNVLKAIDDSGLSLVTEQEKREAHFSPRLSSQGSEIKERLKLLNPAREANVIQELSGTIEFADPMSDPKAKLIAKKFMKENGKVLQFLKPYKIEMAIFTNRELEALSKQKTDPNQTGLLSKLKEGFTFEKPNQMLVLVDDPEGKFLNFEILDSKGKPFSTKVGNYFRSFQTTSMVLDVETLPPPDAQLAVYVQTPKSLVKIPFKLNDIPLP